MGNKRQLCDPSSCFVWSHKVATGKSRLHPGVFSSAAMQTVSEVLNKLLVAGITDLDADVRYAVLDSFDDQFDPHLAQAENLSALFVSLQVRYHCCLRFWERNPSH